MEVLSAKQRARSVDDQPSLSRAGVKQRFVCFEQRPALKRTRDTPLRSSRDRYTRTEEILRYLQGAMSVCAGVRKSMRT
jgi:hypothetical protein